MPNIGPTSWRRNISAMTSPPDISRFTLLLVAVALPSVM